MMRHIQSIRTYLSGMPGEEKANTVTHLVPLIGTFVAGVPLLQSACRTATDMAPDMRVLNIIGVVLFLTGMALMYGSSTLYHLMGGYHAYQSEGAAGKHVAALRIFDHISIYVMIAGSYSLICLSVVGGWIGWTLFAFLWGCVLVGVISKFVALGKHPGLSLGLYLGMGWIGLLILAPMWRNMPHSAFWWIIAEGVFYSVGAYFFNQDEKHAYYHAIWHVFIVLGSMSHTIATWLILSN